MMSLDIEEIRRRKRTGHRYVQLVVQRQRRPRTRRVRVAPGVLGTVIGETGNVGHYLVDVLIEDILQAADRPTQAKNGESK